MILSELLEDLLMGSVLMAVRIEQSFSVRVWVVVVQTTSTVQVLTRLKSLNRSQICRLILWQFKRFVKASSVYVLATATSVGLLTRHSGHVLGGMNAKTSN